MAALVLAGLAAYANSCGGAFVFDDLPTIVANPHVRQLWPIWEAMRAPGDCVVTRRPIVCLSLALNYAVGGLNPLGYHVFNLAVHILCGLLVFGIVWRVLSRPQFCELFGTWTLGVSTAIAAIWLLHPLQTESVTYITQRTESLAGLFYLLTLYCALRAWTGSTPGRWSAAAVFACALGMGSKEIMISAPLLVLLFDRAFISGSLRACLRDHARLYAGLAAGWLVLAALVIWSPASNTVGFAHGISALDYLKMQAGGICHYLRLSFWPRPLLISYTHWPVGQTWSQIAPQGLLVLALVAVTVVGLIRNSWMGFLGAWFFLILAPTSSFVPIVTEPLAERRMYLPLVSVIILVVVGASLLLRRAATRLGTCCALGSNAAVGIGLILVLLGHETARRNQDYRSETAMWAEMVQKCPENLDARVNLGGSLMQEGNYAAAEKVCLEVLERKPDQSLARNNLGVSLLKQAKHSQAVEVLSELVKTQPQHAGAHANLGQALFLLGQKDEAVEHYREALRLEPNSVVAHVGLARIYREAGYLPGAIEHLSAATQAAPEDPQLHQLWDMLQAEAGQQDAR